MDITANISRIRDFFLFISPEKFDTIVQDKTYSTSFIYFAACMILALPIDIVVNTITSGLVEALIWAPIAMLIFFPIAYVTYLVQHLFLHLLGGQASLLQSVQVFIYGSTGVLILSSVPCIGLLFSLICIANVVTGAARIHKISLLRAIVALLIIPGLLLIAAAVVLTMVYSSMIMGSGSLLMP